MARALALTPECLDCTARRDGGDTSPLPPSGGGPSIITRPPSDLGSGGGTSIIPGNTGTTQQPVTVGTSALPSSGPSVIKPPPGESPATSPLPWRKILIGAGVLVAVLLLTSSEKRGPK